MMLQLGAAVSAGTRQLWVSPTLLFVIVLVAASLCAVSAAVVMAVAWSIDGAELGMVAAFAMSVSVLPLVHGLTTPGVLYGPNAATMSSVMLALPWASVAVLPLIKPRSAFGRWASHRWKWWVSTHVVLLLGLGIALLARPSLLPAPRLGAGSSILIAVASLPVCVALSVRHLRLSWISGTHQPFMVSVGFAFIGTASLVWVAQAPFTAGFWVAHLFDIVGVFGVTIGAFIAYHQRRPLTDLLRPLVANEPLSAFELGLEPLVHRFVAMLATKDVITRDHVVRTAAHAIRVGEQLKLPGVDIHRLGLGALLHDLGKLSVPDSILNKAGRLDADEFEVVKRHTIAGQLLVEQSTVLADIGPIVRGHHERMDGGGYPDGLTADQIPLLARIVSVCDAYDAMAFTRQYREGLGHDRAIAVLHEHAGSQWDPTVVAALVACTDLSTSPHSPLDAVGRGVTVDESDLTAWCSCGDAVPDDLIVSR